MQRKHGRLVQARTQGEELQSRGSQDVDLCQKYVSRRASCSASMFLSCRQARRAW